jgi:phytoene synthase
VDPHEYSQRKAAASGSASYYSFLLVKPERRRALAAVHAFAREVRGVADEVRDPGVARAKLTWWREELGRVWKRQAQHPIARALTDAVEAHSLERSDLEEIIHGAAMDLEYNAYPDFEALKVYCRKVSASLWRLSAKILGHQEPRTLEYAEELGVALQLTRFVRNVGEDARRGRVYLPLHEMAEYGVTSDDLVNARESDGLQRLIAFQIARANAHYDRALALLPHADRKSQRPGLAMAAIYRALMREIEDDGCHVLTRRISLTPIRKLWLAWRAR